MGLKLKDYAGSDRSSFGLFSLSISVRFRPIYLKSMPNSHSRFGNYGTTLFFTLLFVGLGIFIGIDLKGGSRQAGKVESPEIPTSQDTELLSTISALKDSIRVLLSRNTQLQTTVSQPVPQKVVLEPTLVFSGGQRELFKGKVLVTVSPHPYNDTTEAEVTIRRTKSPLERSMQYGEVLRLFYAYTGRQETFEFEDRSYYIHFLQVGKVDGKLAVKFAIYEK